MRKGKTKRFNDGVHSLALFRRRPFLFVFLFGCFPNTECGRDYEDEVTTMLVGWVG